MTWLLKNWRLALIGVLVLLLAGQQVRVHSAKADAAEARLELANDRTRYAQAAQLATDSARETETQREAAKTKVIQDAQLETLAAQKAARDADAAAGVLRGRLAAFIAASRGAGQNPTIGTGSPPADTALDLLADVFSRADSAAGELGEYADRARIAGLACERSYDSLK